MYLSQLSLFALPVSCAYASISPRQSPTWQTVNCSVSPITDAAASAASRWAAADVDTAWNATVAAWKSYTSSASGSDLTFVEFVSNFFQGPEGWYCQDVDNTECSTTVQCADTKYPAGFLILNSFSYIHQVHQLFWDALQTASVQMSPQMGGFASTFAPQLPANNNDQIFKDLLDVFSFMIGVGSNFEWNVVIKVAKLFADDNYRGFTKDVVNGAISSSLALVKDNLPAAEAALNVQNSLTELLGTFLNSWQAMESNYTRNIFNGNSTMIDELWSLMQNGMMLALPEDLSSQSQTMASEIETIMWSQMIPIAWQLAPGNLGAFILATGHTCSSTLPQDLSPYMTQDTHSKTMVCWNGNLFYVLNANSQWNPDGDGLAPTNTDPFNEMPFTPLPGGANNVLDGTAWGGVTLQDMVISAYQGYLANGQQNGYKMPSVSQMISDAGSQGELIFQDGINTPGYFSLNVCTSLYTTVSFIGQGQNTSEPNFPCLRWNGVGWQ